MYPSNQPRATISSPRRAASPFARSGLKRWTVWDRDGGYTLTLNGWHHLAGLVEQSGLEHFGGGDDRSGVGVRTRDDLLLDCGHARSGPISTPRSPRATITPSDASITSGRLSIASGRSSFATIGHSPRARGRGRGRCARPRACARTTGRPSRHQGRGWAVMDMRDEGASVGGLLAVSVVASWLLRPGRLP